MIHLKEKKFEVTPSELSAELVAEALIQVESKNYPTRRDEDWRYAKLGKILNQEWRSPKRESLDINQYIPEDFTGSILVSINGFYESSLSKIVSQEGVTVLPLSEATDKDLFKKHYGKVASQSTEIFTAINTAYNQGGIFIHAEKNVSLEANIYFLNLYTGDNQMVNERNLLILDQGAEINLIQGYFSTAADASGLINSVSEFVVAANAKCTVDKIQKLGTGVKHICREDAYQVKDSTFKISTFSLTGDFIRNGVNVAVEGQNAYTEMNGLFLGAGQSFVDNHTRVDHIKSNCVSSELYKGILRDKSTGVFNGKVIVHKDAQVIEAYQQNNNVILSDNATMNTKPELEIYADDVKCSHGTTTGQFDEKAIFYLQARGISKETAKNMLVEAFADEVLDKLNDISFVEEIRKCL